MVLNIEKKFRIKEDNQLNQEVIFLNIAFISSEAPFDVKPYIRFNYNNLEEVLNNKNL